MIGRRAAPAGARAGRASSGWPARRTTRAAGAPVGRASSGWPARRRGRTARAAPRGQRARIQAPARDEVRAHRSGVAQHALGAPGEPARARQPVPDPLVGREVARSQLPRAVVHGQHERDLVADRQRRRGRGPHDVAARQQLLEPRAPAGRRGAEQQARGQRGAHRRHAVGRPARAARQQDPPLVAGERGRQRRQQRARIVRDAARPAPGETAPVDADPHARCPARSPSTLAPPRAPSSAGSSAGRVSSRAACRRCVRDAMPC